MYRHHGLDLGDIALVVVSSGFFALLVSIAYAIVRIVNNELRGGK